MAEPSAAPRDRIALDIKRGHVTISALDPHSIDAKEATERESTVKWDADPPIVKFSEAVTPLGTTWRFETEQRRNVTLNIGVPASVGEVDIDLGMGELTLRGLSAQLSIDMGLGPAHLEDITGNASIDLGKGDLRARHIRGNLDVDTGLGSTWLEDVEGRLDIDSGAGSVKLVDCAVKEGDFDLGTGSLTLLRTSGWIKTDSGMGSVRVDEPQDLSLEVNSGMGSLHVQGGRLVQLKGELGSGSANLQDVHILAANLEIRAGAVRYSVPDTQRGRIEALSHRGRVVTDLNRVGVPFPGASRAGERVVLNLESGTEVVVLETRRGNIMIQRSTGQAGHPEQPTSPSTPPSSAPTSPTPGDPPDPRRAILERVANGQLTTEEAGRLLEGLDKGTA